jgi:formate/nitrite transporter FocA (FNT family)
VHGQAVNDDVYDDGVSPVWLVFAVLGNVIGGALLLSGMFILPYVLAEILG